MGKKRTKGRTKGGLLNRAIVFGALCATVVLSGAACSKSTQTSSPSSSPTASASVSTAAPTLQLATGPTATVISGDTATIALDVSGIRIVAPDGDISGKTGHLHVFIDKDPVAAGAVIPKAPGIVHTADNPIHLTGLTDGEHKLVIVLGDGVHRRIGNAQVTQSIKIAGPTVHLTAPATVAAGQPLTVTATVEGVQLVKPADDKSNKDGSTGHLHLFVNKSPTAPGGAPIPSGDPAIIHTAATTTDIPATLLKAGDNTIWVELGFADHTPFSPEIVDRVVVSVTPAPATATATVTATATP
jgi:hypothetical protein